MMDFIKEAGHWMSNHAALLQVTTAVLQAAAAVFAIPISYKAAMKATEKASRLSKEEALRREDEERKKQENALFEQKKSLRLLINLEIKANTDTLSRLHGNLLSEEDDTARIQSLLRFTPIWNQRAWYGQQSSALLLAAFNSAEIKEISDFHNQLSHLDRLEKMLRESVLPSDGTATQQQRDFWYEFRQAYTILLDGSCATNEQSSYGVAGAKQEHSQEHQAQKVAELPQETGLSSMQPSYTSTQEDKNQTVAAGRR